jgi:hypothetical protein
VKRVAVFAFAAIAAVSSAEAGGYSAKTWRKVWTMVCEPGNGGDRYAITWNSPRSALETMSKRGVVRSYPGVAIATKKGFEVFAARADQDRTLHAIFDDRSGLLIVTGQDGGVDDCNVMW